MVDINPTMSIITLNINGLNAPIKRQIVRVDQNTDPILYCLQEIHFRYKEKYEKLDYLEIYTKVVSFIMKEFYLHFSILFTVLVLYHMK